LLLLRPRLRGMKGGGCNMSGWSCICARAVRELEFTGRRPRSHCHVNIPHPNYRGAASYHRPLADDTIGLTGYRHSRKIPDATLFRFLGILPKVCLSDCLPTFLCVCFGLHVWLKPAGGLGKCPSFESKSCHHLLALRRPSCPAPGVVSMPVLTRVPRSIHPYPSHLFFPCGLFLSVAIERLPK
jgi:hypothetical protein